MKNPEERIESLEKSVRLYRILFLLCALLIMVLNRYQIVGWIDSVEHWLTSVSRATGG